jgi:hypothetical protein
VAALLPFEVPPASYSNVPPLRDIFDRAIHIHSRGAKPVSGLIAEIEALIDGSSAPADVKAKCHTLKATLPTSGTFDWQAILAVLVQILQLLAPYLPAS